MKKIFIFALMLCIPVLANAQVEKWVETGRPINRLDGQVGTTLPVTQTGGITHTFKTATHPVLPQGTQSGKSFKVVIHDTVISGTYGGNPELAVTVTCTAIMPVNMIFERTHLIMDTNVSSGICLCSCYADFLDTLPASNACPLGGTNPPWTFLFHPRAVNPLSTSDSVVDYIKLTALTGDPGDTVSFIMKGVFSPSAGVADKQKQTATGPKITAVYPSPLVQGNSIKVKVASSKESTLSYSIYDGVGRSVALGVTRQHIGLGDNTISIGSLDGLTNGTYMLKFNFGDGSSSSYFFQVLK